ncbi:MULTISPECIES: hypothetical protein [unclassified Inquilinus]|uniref:hypothetical protein n=1 Tax=unclassified Inquilinus TaxID=2645927 RepID=UPI003F92B7BC
MSGYDLGIWFTDVAMDRGQAAAFLDHVGSDQVIVRRHPSFDAFWIELHTRFPDGGGGGNRLADLDLPPMSMLSSLEEIRSAALAFVGNANPPPILPDETIWAEGPLRAQGCIAILSVAWSHAGDIVPQIQALAARHGLVVFDTQSGEVTLPPGLDAGPSNIPEARLRLEVTGSVPAFNISILLDGQPVSAFVAPSRQDAHARARSIALERGLPFYEVSDPDSVAQSIRPRSSVKPLSPDDPKLGYIEKFLAGFDIAPDFPSKAK